MEDKHNRYLDKIIQYIVDDTRMNYDEHTNEVITYPFYVYTDYLLLPALPTYFYNYVKDMYGLTDQEIEYVWDEYRFNILNKKSKPMNESINTKRDYLDRIVQFMVDDTEIDHNNNSVNLLFLNPPMLLFFFPHPLPSPILDYCKDVYGLTDDETNYVLREYKGIIVNEFKKKKTY